MPDYNNGKIYMIYPTCEYEEGDIYYGSTIQPLSRRMSAHRCGNQIKLLADKYGLENLKIELVCEYKCETKEQLNKEEGKYIRENKCINKRIAGRTNKEYFEDNKDNILEQHKQRYEANKKIINEKQKQYNEANKQYILEYKKQRYEDNKDKLLEKQKQYYLKKKCETKPK
tara:strand:+ start:182 stop:694 length:513 start_codon:yes stop_codon:yes gene_type:complete